MKSAGRILLIEDMASLAMIYAGHLEAAGHVVDIADRGQTARERLAATDYDVVLLDLQLPDCDGLDWLNTLPGLTDRCSVIVVTADGSIKRAIGAMRLGAYDFLVKPLAPERLLTTVRNALDKRALIAEVASVRKLADRTSFHGFVGTSRVMQAVYRTIESVADSRATVFITGESGTGKDVAAEALHRASKRSGHAFVAINCAAIPDTLLESELFGHVRGAFTGATENRVGAAKEADGGTLFLDEICEMDLKLQVKLLRFLQTGLIQRVGSSRPEAVNVRIVCATNRDVLAEVAAGRFREDLFYRLAVIPLEMPPLRDRDGDVELLATAFVERFAEQEGKQFAPLSAEARARLRERPWRGNVRELQNYIRRAVVMSTGPTLSLTDFATAPTRDALPAAVVAAPPPTPVSAGPDLASLSLADLEQWAIEKAIERAGGSLPRAARALGISPSTLYRKRERLGAD